MSCGRVVNATRQANNDNVRRRTERFGKAG